MRQALRLATRALAFLLTSYGLAAVVLGLVPVNRAFEAPRDGVELAIVSNGFHADLVLPLKAAGVDWTIWFPPPPALTSASHIAIGWGDRAFYLGTPTLADMHPVTALRALAWSDDVAIHGAFLRDPDLLADRKRLVLSPDVYRRLAADIRDQIRPGPDDRALLIASPGYGPRHVFVAARGTYSPFQTCNEWLAARLRAAGVRTGLWAPFAFGVTAHL